MLRWGRHLQSSKTRLKAVPVIQKTIWAGWLVPQLDESLEECWAISRGWRLHGCDMPGGSPTAGGNSCNLFLSAVGFSVKLDPFRAGNNCKQPSAETAHSIVFHRGLFGERGNSWRRNAKNSTKEGPVQLPHQGNIRLLWARRFCAYAPAQIFVIPDGRWD